MKKRIFNYGLIIIMILMLTGCFYENPLSTTNNNITNKIVTVEDFTIGDFQTALQVAIEKAESSSISILHSEGGWLGSTSLGSGVVVSQEEVLDEKTGKTVEYKYLAVTNRHVVMTSRNLVSQNLKVYIGDNDHVIDAECIAYTEKADLALVSFTSTIYLPKVTFGETTNLKKGTFVVAVGSPYSLEFYQTATFGIISYPLRYLEDEVYNGYETTKNAYIQHDASINSGNSGGGLFDMEGKLIGINTQKIQSQADNVVEGMGFSIPTHIILDAFKDYIK